MSDSTGTPFSTERELAEDEDVRRDADAAGRPDLKAAPSNPPVDEEALAKSEDVLARVKPY